MIKLRQLIFEEEYPADAPDHFGGGENIDILNQINKEDKINKIYFKTRVRTQFVFRSRNNISARTANIKTTA